MRPHHDVWPVVLFAATTTWGAVVSVREHVPGEPLLVRVPGSIPRQLAAGWGAGLSAPWPMVALAVGNTVRSRPDHAADRVLTTLGVCVCLGTAIEPVTWGRRARSRGVASAVVLNLAAAAAMIRAGRAARKRSWRVRRRPAS